MTERESRQPALIDTVEAVTDLRTGEKTFRKRKKLVRRQPTPKERAIALLNWESETGFSQAIHAGATAYQAGEAVKMADRSGINVSWDGGLGAKDDAERAFAKVFNPELIRFKPIRAVDITSRLVEETAKISDRLKGAAWIQDYVEWVIDIMSLERKYSYQMTENLKVYARQPRLRFAS
ncbi:hypothetical protein A2870_03010 [Candidatus Curtissbacteria bacterium RIFCSPHIGHO2_01_FULL_41_11]|uniref:Uncharacterized protein n=1 Tax=Candidatus Curtissbacteria bacterium RIFCSPHIGHO2_01_FULL_41_11 TaxID=1797711 RepID=A0A1F5G6Y4_9BACT|nr:MAG: hypothetical protein A2870_03010 [Candidatus Curtissbacteria bacterium RIFCSPHIGHO2_01_FULL_41_11]